jgi:hypothetical protein
MVETNMSYIQGASESAHEQFQNREKGMFEMALLSKRMELQSAEDEKKLMLQHQLSQVPGEQVAALGQGIAKNDWSGLKGQQIDEKLAATALSATGRVDARMNAPIKPLFKTRTDANGIDHVTKIDPDTMQEVGEVSLGLNRVNAKAVRASNAATETVRTIIQNMNKRIEAALVKSPEYVPGQRANITLNRLLPYDPELKRFIDGQADRALQIIKLTQGTVGRSWEQVKAELQGFGNGTDYAHLAIDKNNDKMADIDAQNSATLASFDPTNELKSKNHPLAIGHQNALDKNQAGDPDAFVRKAIQARMQREAMIQPQKQGKK